MSGVARDRRPARPDRRGWALAFTAAVITLGGVLLQVQQGDGAEELPQTQAPARIDPRADPAAHAGQARGQEVKRRFEQAVVMLHAREYEHALTALHRVLQMAPEMPEAHVNMGFALLGMGGLDRAAAARDFFNGAIALRAEQANAYYGLALSHEALGDMAPAIGAMRTFLHRSRGESEAHLRRARAALWEWEARRPTSAASTASAATAATSTSAVTAASAATAGAAPKPAPGPGPRR